MQLEAQELFDKSCDKSVKPLNEHTTKANNISLSNLVDATTSYAPVPLKNKPSILYRQFQGPSRLVLIVLSALLLLCLLLLVLLLSRVHCSSTQSSIKEKPIQPPIAFVWKNRNNKACQYQRERLPKAIQPSHYSVHLHPNLSEPIPNYRGNVTIDATCWDSTNRLVFHSSHHTIHRITVTSTNKNAMFFDEKRDVDDSKARASLITPWEECTSLQQIYVPLQRRCESGESIQIIIHFEGTLRTSLDGFYISNYTSAGKVWRIGTTQMEAYFARTALPCFDEPAMKATFQFNIVRENTYFTLFNSPLVRTEELGSTSLLMDVFNTSEKMSTYLVAFLVVPVNYNYVEDYLRDIKIRVYAPKSQKPHTKLALNATKTCLAYFERFFGVNYTMNKLDSIAVPEFAAGAMENWGLIIYRPQALLFNEDKDSFTSKVQVIRVVAHETAHQWFGNLVTMKWWNDIYLNEGFATYMESLGAGAVDQSFDYRSPNYLNYMSALRMDGVINTHPVAVPENYTNADALFDIVSYKKGASLLEMLESFMGLENVKKALRRYIQRFRYNNTVSNDLWNVMTEVYREHNPNSILDVREVMNTWTLQSNYPIIHVNLSEDGTYFSVSQERFLMFEGALKLWQIPFPSPYNFEWDVPLKYITSENLSPQVVWLFRGMKQGKFNLPSPTKWVKVNKGHRGYFVTNYDERTWRAIIEQLKRDPMVFDQNDRAGFIFDAFEIASSGKLAIDIALDLLDTLSQEKEFLPWRAAREVILSMSKFLYSDQVIHEKFRMHVREVVKPLVNHPKVGWRAMPSTLTMAEVWSRYTILRVSLFALEEDSVKNAKQIFNNYLKNETDFGELNIFPLIVTFGLQEGGPVEWDQIWERYQKITDPGVAANLRTALAATENWRLLYKLLAFSLDSSKIRVMDSVRLMVEMGRTPISSDIVWSFIQRNAKLFNEKLGEQKMLVNDLVQTLAYSFMTEYDYNRMKAFFKNNPFGQSLGDGSAMALEQIQINMHWQRQNLQRVRDYYNRKYPS